MYSTYAAVDAAMASRTHISCPEAAVPAKPREAAKSWLKSEKSVRKLRELAEREARREAVERARRRGQL